MPGKGKGKARGKSRGKRKSEKLEWQIRYRIRKDLLLTRTAAEIRRAALEYYRANGDEMPGTHMVIRWRNKDNKNRRHANWKTSDDDQQTLGAAFSTLHGSMDRALYREVQDTEIQARPARKVTVTAEQRAGRSAAMKAYHAQLREIRAAHPAWTQAAARAEYRRRKAR